MKTKWTSTALALLSLVVTACSLINQSSTPTTTADPQPSTSVVKPESQTSPSVTLPPISGSSGQTKPSTQSSKPTPVTGNKTAEVAVNDLNVRSSPNTTSQIRGTLPKGTQAKIIQQQGNWYYIVMGKVEGWVSGAYIKVLDGDPGSVAPQPSKPTPVTGNKTAEVAVNDLNVRSSPNTTSQIRGTLPKGTQAKIIQQQGNWYYIVMGKVEGWVSDAYIKVLDGDPGSAKSR